MKIKERTVRGRKERCRRGLLPTGVNAYGYLYMKGKGESRGIRIPDAVKAPHVVSIFKWYVEEGLSLYALSERLYHQGVPTPTSKARWSRPTLHAILRNPAYIGKTLTHWQGSHEDIEVPGATPAIISPAVFQAAQERMRLNKENARRRMKRDYPLRGLAFCGVCGGRMVGAAKDKKRYYRCWRDAEPGASPHSLYVNAGRLEAQTWATVKNLLSQPELVKAQVAQHRKPADVAGLKAKIATITRRQAALSQGEEAIARSMRRGDITEAVAQSQLREGRQDRETWPKRGPHWKAN